MPSKDVGMIQALPGQVVNLLAGQVYFGSAAARVRTLLGSCVAVTLWNPRRGLGGMCHYLLPSRPPGLAGLRDGRYGDEAFDMLLEALHRHGTRPHDYQVHLYGGADTLSARTGTTFNVGQRNIEQGWALIEQHGFVLDAIDVGDDVPRNVSISLTDGSVEMRRGTPAPRSPLAPQKPVRQPNRSLT